MNILIKLPSRGRPEKLRTTFAKYVEHAEDPAKISFMVTVDDDDFTFTNIASKLLKCIHNQTTVIVGPPCGKIGAVNRDMDKAGVYDILLLASDDMIPVQKGYDRIIRESMEKFYPDTDGVLFFNDGHHGDKLNTLCILGKKYYERFGYIYHPSYKTEFCDNEFMDVANQLGRQTYIDQVIIEHKHPLWTGEVKDPTYLQNDTHINEDKQNYLQRRGKGFPR
jgi:hypothetical protein